MRTHIVLAAILCLLFSFSQANAIQAQQTQKVKTCQIQPIIEDVEEFVNNTWELFDEVYISYKNLVVEAVECTNDFSDYSDIVSCVATAMSSWVKTLGPQIEQYNDNLIALGEQFVNDVYNCA